MGSRAERALWTLRGRSPRQAYNIPVCAHGVWGWKSRVVPTSAQKGLSLETLIPQDGITQKARHKAEDRAVARVLGI